MIAGRRPARNSGGSPSRMYQCFTGSANGVLMIGSGTS
jgi:hypothetical protein